MKTEVVQVSIGQLVAVCLTYRKELSFRRQGNFPDRPVPQHWEASSTKPESIQPSEYLLEGPDEALLRRGRSGKSVLSKISNVR